MNKIDDDEESQTLSLGWIIGGSTSANKSWNKAIRDLCDRIDDAGKGMDAPLNLNVVFHVPGNMLKPEFDGVRTGRFSKARSLLMVQVAVPEEVPVDPAGYLRSAIRAAIDEAAQWAARRKVPIDVSKLYQVLDRA